MKPTREQVSTLFADASKDMTPADPKAATLSTRLSPYRHAILEYRAKGFSWDQLRAILASPKINIDVSGSMLRKYLTNSAKKPAAGRGVTQRKSAAQPVSNAPLARPNPAVAAAMAAGIKMGV